MISRKDIISKAIKECLQELYKYVQPHIEWDEFIKENKIYSNKYKAWERYYKLSKQEALSEEELKEFSVYPNEWKDKSLEDCIGPCPYDFYYLPKEIMDDICDSYIYAYKLDNKQELLDTIEVLKNYCKNPSIDKYIESWTDEKGHHPGYKSYDYPDNLEIEIKKILGDIAEDNEYYQHKLQDKFFEFLDMAGNFYDWNTELNTFKTSVYLGPSPNTNKQAVIDNWKQYRNQTIEINDNEYDNEEQDFD